MQILVVEDDDTIRTLLEEVLASSGHTVFTARHGQEALEQLASQSVELVLTDWMMARLDGLGLIRRIRASTFPDYIYIIVLTAKGGKDDVVTALQAGADDYLTKPFDLDELEARIAAGERRLSLEQQLRQARDAAIEQAHRDSLTGILNREGIMEQAEAALALAQREGRAMSVALLDLDRFKEINDEYGHLIGDQALKLLSETICRALRTGDWLGRWGGDEFLIVFAGTSIAGACQAGERVRRLLSMTSLPLPDNTRLQLRISMGIAEAEPGDYPALQELIKRADQALYQAKREGRNRVTAYPSARA